MTAKEIQQYGTSFADVVARKNVFRPDQELTIVSQSHTEKAIKISYVSGITSLGVAYPTEFIVKMMENMGIDEVKKVCGMTPEQVSNESNDEEDEEDESSNKKPNKVLKLRKRG